MAVGIYVYVAMCACVHTWACALSLIPKECVTSQGMRVQLRLATDVNRSLMVSITSSEETSQPAPDYLIVSTVSVRSLKPCKISLRGVFAHYRPTLAAGLLPVLQYVKYINYVIIILTGVLSSVLSQELFLQSCWSILSISALVSYALVGESHQMF